ncbi:hypothetical protein [Streptomyces sp. NPDC058612]|uniref:hypothetical protein n=1 Tax=Streptomyces sp. NPDC058612 TaxID=3346555 RepID=UPI0036622C11
MRRSQRHWPSSSPACSAKRLPPLTATNRDYAVLTLLDRAAAACSESGERLVLVVDGIDEDRGVSAGPDAYGIASMLPAQPTGGLRVILAGRLHPHVPEDVPPHHPLRDPGIVRHLRPSDRAAVVRRDMLRELAVLLGGDPVERDLLGVLTAAGGGLTARDLGELIHRPAWEVREHLGSFAGRSFGIRESVWHPDERPDEQSDERSDERSDVYVLGHEELQATAAERIGEPDLDAYRLRLHAWAEGYRARGWPAHSPEYLLRGYFRLVHTADDLEHMFACAVDAPRHDRMRDASGSDAAALEEIGTTLHAFAGRSTPDLVALGRLSVHRAALSLRNQSMPRALPGVWCALGQVARAEALARAMPPYSRAVALTDLARHLAGTGNTDRAAVLTQQAEAFARLPLGDRWPALAALARAYSAIGDTRRALTFAEEAETAAHGITWALVDIAGVMARVGAAERAEAIITALPDPRARTCALIEQALSLVEVGDTRQARIAGGRGVALVTGLAETGDRASVLVRVAQGLAATGDPAPAVALAEAAEALADSVNPFTRAAVLAKAARVLAAAGDATRAGELIGRAERSALEVEVGDPRNRATALTGVARAMADVGLPDRATAMAERAEVISRSPDLASAAHDLSRVAIGLVQAGAADRARAVARAAEDLLRSAEGSAALDAQAQTGVAVALARTGDIERADARAASIRSTAGQASALAGIATTLATTDRREEAGTYARRAHGVARTVSHPDLRAWMLHEVAGALATAGDIERAEEIGRGLPPALRADVLADVALAHAAAGHTERARASVDAAAAILSSASSGSTEDWARADLAVVMANLGWTDRAEALGDSVVDATARSRALTAVATALARSGLTERAGTLADEVDAFARSMSGIGRPEELLCELATRVQPERARQRLARALLNGGWRPCLEALAHADPASVHAITTEVLARHDHDGP